MISVESLYEASGSLSKPEIALKSIEQTQAHETNNGVSSSALRALGTTTALVQKPPKKTESGFVRSAVFGCVLDLIEGRLGQLASGLLILENLVEAHGVVERKTEADGVSGLQHGGGDLLRLLHSDPSSKAQAQRTAGDSQLTYETGPVVAHTRRARLTELAE